MGSDSHSETARNARLAKALRVNLKRRKAQARNKTQLRAAGNETPETETGKEKDKQDQTAPQHRRN